MLPKFLSPALHGALDYIAAGALIALPIMLQLTGIAFWLSVGGGIGLIAYSLVTDYKFGSIKLLSFDLHLILDLAAGAAFAAAPFVLGFDQPTSIYYFVMAAGVIAVVAFTARASKA